MLRLNDKEIKGHELKVSMSLALTAEDASGQSSSTATAETGDKPKQMAVKLSIKYKDAEDLTALIDLAEAKNETGERLKYDVVNDTAEAVNIRKANFMGGLSVREDETLKMWRVSFKLSEIQSVAEQKEAREKEKEVSDQKPTGSTVEPTDTATPKVEDLTTFEKVLSWVDSLGNDESAA